MAKIKGRNEDAAAVFNLTGGKKKLAKNKRIASCVTNTVAKNIEK
jgi:hypothetical protein